MALAWICWLIITMKKQLIRNNQLLCFYLFLFASHLQGEENTQAGHRQCGADHGGDGIDGQNTDYQENTQQGSNADNAGDVTISGDSFGSIFASANLTNAGINDGRHSAPQQAHKKAEKNFHSITSISKFSVIIP